MRSYRYHRFCRDLWPGAYRAEVEADRAARRARARSQLHQLTRHVNGGGHADDDHVLVDVVDHRHGGERHL